MKVVGVNLPHHGSVKLIEVDGAPVVAAYSHIVALLQTALTEREIDVFAQPVWDKSGRLSGWQSRSGNALFPASELPASKRRLMIEQCNRTFRKIRDLIGSMEQVGGSGNVVSQTLEALLQTPHSDRGLFTDGDGPVLINWACTRDVDAPVLVPEALAGSGEVIAKAVAEDDQGWMQTLRAKKHLLAPALIMLNAVVVVTAFHFAQDGEIVFADPEAQRAIASAASPDIRVAAVDSGATQDSAPLSETLSTPVVAATTELVIQTANASASAPRPTAEDLFKSEPALAITDVAASGSAADSDRETGAVASLASTSATFSDDSSTTIHPTVLLAPNSLPEPARLVLPMEIGIDDDRPFAAQPEPAMIDVSVMATDSGITMTVLEMPERAEPLPASTAEVIEALSQYAEAPEPAAPFPVADVEDIETLIDDLEVPKPEPTLAIWLNTQALPAISPEKSDASVVPARPDLRTIAALEVASDLDLESEGVRLAELAMIEDDLGMSRRGRVDLQRRLKLLGFNPRGIDGIFGARTRAAISEWQRSRGHAPTGFLDTPQLAEIEAQSMELFAQWRREERRRAEAFAKASKAEAERARLAAFESRKSRNLIDQVLYALSLSVRVRDSLGRGRFPSKPWKRGSKHRHRH